MKSSIYLNKHCPYSTALIWILYEKTPSYSFKLTHFSHRHEMLGSNVLMRAYTGPLLVSTNIVVSNFETIVLYLNERYPTPALLPDNLEDTMRLRLFIKRMIADLFNIDATKKNILQDKLESMLEDLIKYREFQGKFTIVDCLLAAIVYYGLHINLEFKGPTSILLNYLEESISRDNRFKKMAQICDSFSEILA